MASNDGPGFEIRYSAVKKKCLFATKKFSAGEVIFEEKPLVACQFLWNKLYKYAACDFCLRPLETAEENARRLTNNAQLTLPFPQCCSTKKELHIKCESCGEMYCSEACREQAWNQYHQVLCSLKSEDPTSLLGRLQEAWRHTHYPPETASIMLIIRMLATVKQTSDKDTVLKGFSQFYHQVVNEETTIAHKLLGEKYQAQLEQLHVLFTEAVYDEYLSSWFTPEGFRSLVALVGINAQGIGTSPLGVWSKNCDELLIPQNERETLDNFITNLYEEIDKESGSFLDSEGSGLYALHSTCNHSCVPNAFVSFPYNNFIMVMKAIHDIEPQEEIVISYLDECVLSRSRHSRIKVLRENYLFTCTCPKCEEEADQPDVTSDEEMDEEEND